MTVYKEKGANVVSIVPTSIVIIIIIITQGRFSRRSSGKPC